MKSVLSYLVTLFWGFLVIIALVACRNHPTKPEDVRVPDAAPILEGINFTQATVLGEAADVRFELNRAVEASKGLPSEAAVRDVAKKVEASLSAVEDAIKRHPAADVEKLVADFRSAIDQLREVIKQRDAEIQSLKDANARTWHWILYGGAVIFTVLAVASGFFASSIPIVGPYLGPRIGVLCGAIAATLYVLGYLYDWTKEHPVYTGVAVALLVGGSFGLAWANKIHHDHEKKALLPNLNITT